MFAPWATLPSSGATPDGLKSVTRILLTATPHSGDEEAFHNLLGLIDEAFAALPELAGDAQRNLREKLAAHFIQRRRSDIDAWREPGLFPQHETSELKYRLTGDYEDFYGQILDYCAEIVLSAEGDARQRLAFWGTLALMRCVGSSPAAAARALKTRAAARSRGSLGNAHRGADPGRRGTRRRRSRTGCRRRGSPPCRADRPSRSARRKSRGRSQIQCARQGPQGADP